MNCPGLLWLAFLLIVGCQGAPQADLVESLPGWGAALLSKTYSGYIGVGSKGGNQSLSTLYEHYLFFESEAGDPLHDPVIMWTNGGPGVSSFFGSFSELGPYFLSEDSLKTDSYRKTGVPSLFENVYRWTKLGNLLIRNLPPPIGFSYCDPAGPAGDGYSCGPWNDTSVAKHSYEFMNNWANAFSEYRGDLFLSGESYAGVYVPTLARVIQDHGGSLAAKLKGILVGDGCTEGCRGPDCECSPFRGPLFQIEFYHGHGQFSTRTHRLIKSKCSEEELLHGVHEDNEQCLKSLAQMNSEIGYSFSNNLYDECYDFNIHFGSSSASSWKRRLTSPARWSMDGSPCGGTVVMPKWVSAPGVKKALHVAENANWFNGDDGHGFTYAGTEPDLREWYKTNAAKNVNVSVASDKRLRVLIYNGDTDPGLNSFLAENWTAGLGLDVKEAWRPWTRDGKVRMGGYVTRYQGSFDYLTIRGAGHMVPQYKPEATFVFLKYWLKNEDYPSYNPPSRKRGSTIV